MSESRITGASSATNSGRFALDFFSLQVTILFTEVGFLQANGPGFRLMETGKLKGGEMFDNVRIRKLASICAMSEMLLFMGVLGVQRLDAQATAAISGTVMDSSGAAIGGATV